MATKQEILQFVKTIAEQNIITKEELQTAYDSGSGIVDNSIVSNTEVMVASQPDNIKTADHVQAKKIGVAEILSYIGGAIVFLGIAILVGQNWDTIGFLTKVLATLGSGIAAYIVGIIFIKDKRTESIAPALFLISALVMPVGFYVILDNGGFDVNGYGIQSFVSFILLIIYFLSYIVFKKNVFVLFSIIYGTWLFFSVTSLLIGEGSFVDTWQFYQYRFLVASVMYLIIAYSFSKTSRAPLSNFLYGFGVFGLLSTVLSLGGWSPDQNVFWELLYPILISGVLYLSVVIKKGSFLLWGSVFLMIFILKITSEYFSAGLGWPFSLVIAGLSMIGVGYLSLNLKNKYLSKK